MRPDSVHVSIAAMLLKFKRLEVWLRSAGVPDFLARVPCSLLLLHYCHTLEAKTARITGISLRIKKWLKSISDLSADAHARTELIDIDMGMRNDIEITKRTLWELRDLSLEVARMFNNVGCTSRRLLRLQEAFLQVLTESYETATVLQGALAAHDQRALTLLRQMQADDKAAEARAAETRAAEARAAAVAGPSSPAAPSGPSSSSGPSNPSGTSGSSGTDGGGRLGPA